MSDAMISDTVKAAFASYRAAVTVLGASIQYAEAQGLTVAFEPDPAKAQSFSGYPIPESVSVTRQNGSTPS